MVENNCLEKYNKKKIHFINWFNPQATYKNQGLIITQVCLLNYSMYYHLFG